MPKTQLKNKKKVCQTVLRLAATHGWNNLTYGQIAKSTRMSQETLTKIFPHKTDILSAILCFIDDEVISAIADSPPEGTPHDRLFEVIMFRFDVLQKNRAGVCSILHDLGQTPELALTLLPLHTNTLKKMLNAAGIPTKKSCQLFVMAGLLPIYAVTLYRWYHDHSSDLSKTMATLDRALSWAERAKKLITVFNIKTFW